MNNGRCFFAALFIVIAKQRGADLSHNGKVLLRIHSARLFFT